MVSKFLTALIVVLWMSPTSFAQDSDVKMLSVGLNAASEILIIAPDGKKFGYDAVAKKRYEEIKGATVSTSRDREPVYRVPISDADKEFTVRIFGKTKGTKGDLGITGEGFTFRAIGLALEPRKNFTLVFRPNLSKIQFSANSIVENPAFNLALDPSDATQPSYIFKLSRAKLLLRKIIILGLDLKTDIFSFSDNAAPAVVYSLNVLKIEANGEEKTFANAKIISKKANRFQFDLKKSELLPN